MSIAREGSKWFASLQVQTSQTVPALGIAPTLGIDMGLAQFAAFSEEVHCTSGQGNMPKALQGLVAPLTALGHWRGNRFA